MQANCEQARMHFSVREPFAQSMQHPGLLNASDDHERRCPKTVAVYENGEERPHPYPSPAERERGQPSSIGRLGAAAYLRLMKNSTGTITSTGSPVTSAGGAGTGVARATVSSVASSRLS